MDKPSEPKHRVRILTSEEWTRLEQTAQPWLRPMLDMAVHTGMRLGEITALTWGDVDLLAGIINVPQATKTGYRPVPMNATTRALLEGLPRRGEYVFCRQDGGHYNDRSARNTISKRTVLSMKAAGIEGASFHILRHTAGSWMVQAKRPLAEVQAILGHSNPALTNRYAHLNPDHLRASITALDGTAVATVIASDDVRSSQVVDGPAWAFSRRTNPLGVQLRAMFSSDLGHWDVPDMTGILGEAHELVDRQLIDEHDFEDFVFRNPVRFYTSVNPDFFVGTRVEAEAARVVSADGAEEGAEAGSPRADRAARRA